ncbi:MULTISPECIES: type II toxin-antitoxin system Phd/YefM family antitoxin [Streptomyces]|uniref:Antitoxin n=1 Tax=Streptomyces tsukubensis (strain DSM 42081 / NBRC 108919 / NRRL 18488 / 9993) TaxID=1114943 RepID=I2MWL9_STRT9|nr:MULTISPECIES: type II toxin-antitoxin system Phd/YefM family antitoxin [Streptomyces]AZK93592.1 prevent-host-death protein [Streptomyces tsukubensis]EIF89166.1 Prevent-host-death family protein [Streptomyces tsukubensis NRRL18488]MYS66747.1 type II toxin-antitoxin system prevent-host-death family antitoxin [Streptomyces sp. SID5473]QKM70260.1 type II toxin-antitoxin system Phd/YefM family antitoxin [Streptomyces tsukubensis NRRL18488]TAI45759.1 type II toxin-antitoxin system Phd/YefM family
MTDHLSMRETRARLPEILNRAESGEATVITRNGRPVAAVVPLDEYSALEDAADELLAREALRHLDEPTSSMAEVLADVFGERDGEPAGRTDAA